MHALLRARFGVTRIIASGLPPMAQFPLLPDPLAWVLSRHAARLDATLAGLAAGNPALEHVPLSLPFAPEYVSRDGFHPGALAYDRWAGMLAGRLRQSWRGALFGGHLPRAFAPPRSSCERVRSSSSDRLVAVMSV